jgi:hypothetical protein
MESFQSGDFDLGCSKTHDFFDNNIYLYFDGSRPGSHSHAEQRKEEYKVAVGHATLQTVAVALQAWLLEVAGKLLEETLRWAQLNHHETEVQYCLLYKAKLLEQLGDPRLQFTYVEDALVKAQNAGNFGLQLHACLHHIAMEAKYDLKKLRADIGQHRVINSGFAINHAFGKLLSDFRVKKSILQGQENIYIVRRLMINQRKDYLHGLGFRKKNLHLKPIVCQQAVSPSCIDFSHLEALLDEDVALFHDQWTRFLEEHHTHHLEHQLSFFDAYFQVKLLIRRRDLDSAGTYVGIMERIAGQFPEADLLFRLWSLRVDLCVEAEAFEPALVSANFLLREMQREGLAKALYLEQKVKVAAVFAAVGKYAKAFEELNAALAAAETQGLQDLVCRCKLLQARLYSKLGCPAKSLSILRKVLAATMLASTARKLEHKETEVLVCLQLQQQGTLGDVSTVWRRILAIAQDGCRLASKLEMLRSAKQLLFVAAKVAHVLHNTALRDACSLAALKLAEAQRFAKERSHALKSLDDKVLSGKVNKQIGELFSAVVLAN